MNFTIKTIYFSCIIFEASVVRRCQPPHSGCFQYDAVATDFNCVGEFKNT